MTNICFLSIAFHETEFRFLKQNFVSYNLLNISKTFDTPVKKLNKTIKVCCKMSLI